MKGVSPPTLFSTLIGASYLYVNELYQDLMLETSNSVDQEIRVNTIKALTDTIRQQAGGNSSNSIYNNEKSQSRESSSPTISEDAVWKKYYDLFDDEDEQHNASAVLLEHFGCPKFSDLDGIPGRGYDRIPDEPSTWSLFEDAYFAAYGIEDQQDSTEFLTERRRGPSRWDPHRGMKVPFEVRHTPTIGRTVHATQLIKKGTRVWETSHTAAFPQDYTEDYAEDWAYFSSYRRFLEYLHDQKDRNIGGSSKNQTMLGGGDGYDWACDALMWTYKSTEFSIEDDDDDPEGTVACVNFDHGALFNDSRENATLENVVGIDCNDDPNGDWPEEAYPRGVPDKTPPEEIDDSTRIDCLRYCFYALRDIQPGEEFRYDYGYFSDDDDDSEVYVELWDNVDNSHNVDPFQHNVKKVDKQVKDATDDDDNNDDDEEVDDEIYNIDD